MSLVRHIFWTNTLSEISRTPGGLDVREAVARANANLETIRGDCVANMDAALATLENCYRRGAYKSAPSRMRMYRTCYKLIGIADVAGYPAVDRAAYSLCDLLDRIEEAGPWEKEAVTVHMRALRLLRQSPGEVAHGAILEGLAGIIAKSQARPAQVSG